MPPRPKRSTARVSDLSKARQLIDRRGIRRAYSGFLNSEISSPTKAQKRISQPVSRFSISSSQSSYIPLSRLSDCEKGNEEEQEEKSLSNPAVQNFERRRWMIFTRYYELLSKSHSPTVSRYSIASELSVSPATISRTTRKWITDRCLERVQGSGRKRILDRGQVVQFMERRAKECRYCFSSREMGAWVKEEFGRGSDFYIGSIMKEEGWYKSRQKTKPILTDDHKEARLQWSKERCQDLPSAFGNSSTCYIHINEKWFYLLFLRGLLYLPSDVSVYDDEVIQRCSSKTKIRKSVLKVTGY